MCFKRKLGSILSIASDCIIKILLVNWNLEVIYNGVTTNEGKKKNLISECEIYWIEIKYIHLGVSLQMETEKWHNN